jgi:hypothetical protein
MMKVPNSSFRRLKTRTDSLEPNRSPPSKSVEIRAEPQSFRNEVIEMMEYTSSNFLNVSNSKTSFSLNLNETCQILLLFRTYLRPNLTLATNSLFESTKEKFKVNSF